MERLDLRELRTDDVLVISTAHSEYRFRVRNAENRLGDLTGGRRPIASEAVLYGPVRAAEPSAPSCVLERGDRVLFFLAAEHGGEVGQVPTICTSAVTALAVDSAAR